ncbi:MAG: hypothetical protein GEV03_19525 [Streptosporangiales bacterium]|nr:hypothetical protein [Streptosporangiales bacterium]
MHIVSLVLWIATALGGSVLLGRWLQKGGMRQQSINVTRFPSTLILGHFLLAATGLVLWIIYVINDNHTIAWIAFGLIVVVALLGFTMFARWLQGRRQLATAGAGSAEQPAERPAEQSFPLAVVYGHGLLGAATLVLVLLTAAEVLS